MKKKRNTKKTLITWLVILTTLLAVLLGVAVYLSQDHSNPVETDPSTHQNQDNTTGAPGSEDGESTEATTEPEDLQISTKFGDHFYPGKWADQVRTEITEEDIGGYVTYYGMVNGKEEVLFTVYYGKATADSVAVGAMKVDGISMTVSVEMGDFNPDSFWNEEDADTIRAMQEGLNDVLENLKKDPDFTSDIGTAPAESTEHADSENPTSIEETTAPVTIEDLAVSTPYGDLVFPGQWADRVQTKAEEVGIGYAVTFYAAIGEKEAELFTVFFAADSETSFPVGILSVDGVAMDVSVELAEIEDERTWSAEDLDTFSAMQESINYVIEKLKENAEFEPL